MALNTYALVVSYNCAGQFAQNVFHYQFDDATFPTSQQAAGDLITKWDTANRTILRSVLSSSVLIVGYKAGRVSSAGGFESHATVSTVNAGTRSAGISAQGLAPCFIHYPVNLSLGRGRTFLPGISEVDIESGIFTSSFVTAAQTAAGTMFDPLTMTGGGQATFGYFRQPQKVFVAIPESRLSMNLGTQRRRMRPV